ncbi:FecR family protein [Sphingobacterium sp. HMA12]|uniref:FecR family protein n=1 Tax=Sphingobacterium sp. HMA12 TaxID=2050894 RepID=UPI001315ABF0|nr:FecR domain-containing protein [Sphingobacterium sp. HMA12]
MITNELLKRYLQGKCTRAEKKIVGDFLADPDHTAVLHRLMEAETTSLWDRPEEVEPIDAAKISEWQLRLKERIGPLQPLVQAEETQPPLKSKIVAIGRKTIRYVAALLLFAALAGLIWSLMQRNDFKENQTADLKKEIAPGSDRAILKLADGSTISLSDAAKGSIADQGGVKVQKTAEGEIVYAAVDKRASTQSYNSIHTPNGGQYRVTLPDGSRAWLNAASSLTYPVEFEKKERRVKMTGEVYFEIAKITNENKERVPFFVETDKQVIQVLGTTFNVNAYANEPYDCTTLLEGSVRLVAAHSGKSELLKPGQQALVGNNMLLSEADIQQNLAWINGYFIFRREELGGILRKIARWYDVTVECPPELSTMKFTGKVSRSQSLSAVTEMIASINKVKLEIKERRIIVKK